LLLLNRVVLQRPLFCASGTTTEPLGSCEGAVK